MADELLPVRQLVGEAATDLSWVSPSVARFRFAEARTSPFHRLLETVDQSGPARAWADPTDSELKEWLEWWTSSRPRHRLWIRSPAELIDLMTAHYARPTWVFTNGTTCVSIAETGQLTVATHESFLTYVNFAKAGLRDLRLHPVQVQLCPDLHEAEVLAYGSSARVLARTVKMVRGADMASAVFQEAGDVQSGHRREYWFLVHAGGRSVTLKTDEPYRMLNTFNPGGFRAIACATCRHFRFSAMMRESSGSGSGYCTVRELDPALLRSVRPYGEDRPTIVSVFDLCTRHDFIEDADRHPPYLLSPGELLRWASRVHTTEPPGEG